MYLMSFFVNKDDLKKFFCLCPYPKEVERCIEDDGYRITVYSSDKRKLEDTMKEIIRIGIRFKT